MQGYAWLYHFVMGSEAPEWSFRFFHEIEAAVDNVLRNVTEYMCLWELGVFRGQDQREGIPRNYERDPELWKMIWTPLYPHPDVYPSNKSTPIFVILSPTA